MEIRFENVDFAYGKENDPIIQDFSLEAKEGDRIAIKGASGSGKTTLFRLLLGFETPDNGTISFNDKTLKPKQVKQLRKDTTWLPQDLDLGADKLKEVFYYPFSFKINKPKRPKEEDGLPSKFGTNFFKPHYYKTLLILFPFPVVRDTLN